MVGGGRETPILAKEYTNRDLLTLLLRQTAVRPAARKVEGEGVVQKVLQKVKVKIVNLNVIIGVKEEL